jgi:hypothetical protein
LGLLFAPHPRKTLSLDILLDILHCVSLATVVSRSMTLSDVLSNPQL